MSDLPRGWEACTVADLAANERGAITDGPFGSSLKSDHYVSSGLKVIRLSNVGPGHFIDSDIVYVDEARREELARHNARSGDIITAALGEPLGRTCLVPENFGPAIVKADCFRLRTSPLLERDLIVRWLNAPAVRQSFSDRSQGIGRVRINLSALRQTFIPLPPAAEQRRIVAKIDHLSARSKRARDELDRVEVLATEFKEECLVQAFSGSLTAEFRYRRGLKAWSESKLHDLLRDGPTNGWSPKSRDDATGASTLKLTATTSGMLRLDARAVKKIDATPEPTSKYWLKPGDILIQRANAIEHVGVAAIFDGPAQAYIFQT